MTNWSMIILGLVAISGVAWAENSYLVIVPKLFKIGTDNSVSVFIGAVSEPVEVRFELTMGKTRFECKATCKPGETRNATMALPWDMPVGAGELTIFGMGGVRFEEKRDVIIYDDSHVILVQTSASTYRPGETMEVRVVVTDDKLIPIESGEIDIEFYDAALKLVAEYPRFPIRLGMTETIRFPLAEHLNIGTWLISATIRNTTSSVQVLVARPITPSFDLKAIFQRFLLRTEKTLRGVIEMSSDCGEPIFGRALIAIGQITEQDMPTPSMSGKREEPEHHEEDFRKWKSQTMEIAGRVELNYDLLSLFSIDLTRCLAIQVYIQVTDLISGQDRIIRHIIPVFTRDVIYDIRPLQFEAGLKNEFEVIAKRPDGKPTKMEDMIITVRMLFPGEKKEDHPREKLVEIKDFYTRGRNDIGFFNFEIPENCIGVFMMITPLSEDGKQRGYRTRAVPLMPMPPRRSNGAKLSIELTPSMMTPVSSEVDAPVISSQIVTVGKTGNFYVQLLPWKPVEKFEPLPMSYVLLTNGKITRTGDFFIRPTKECQMKTTRSIQPELQTAFPCVFNGTLSFPITRDMLPYSSLLVYTFQPSFGFNVAETYRFSVAGLFQSTLAMNATIVPFTDREWLDTDLSDESSESWEDKVKMMPVSEKSRGKSRVELSFTGTPESTVGFNVFEYDATLQGFSAEMTKERLLQYMTRYEHVPISGMPTMMGEETMVVPREIKESLNRDESIETSEERKSPELRAMKAPAKKSEWDTTTTTTLKPSTEDKIKDSKPIMKSRDLKKEELDEPVDSRETRFFRNEEQEDEEFRRERLGYKVRFPIEKMFFGISSSRWTPVEGDDVYLTSTMGRFYGEDRTRRFSSQHYRRKGVKSMGQYDITFDDNDYVMATSMPRVMLTDEVPHKPMPGAPERRPEDEREEHEGNYEDYSESRRDERPRFGTPAWYEKMNSKLHTISQEAFTFMHSGLSIVTDFESLRIPTGMQRFNLTSTLAKFRTRFTMDDRTSFDIRDDARQLLEEYMVESDASMMTPPVMLEEQARNFYYRSIFFNSSRMDARGTCKVMVPRTKPYSTWLATGFSLHSKMGMAIAQPIRLPTNEGLFVLGNFPSHVRVGEHALLTYGINNYFGKDLSNVIVRIRASADFDLIEQTQPERVASTSGKDYTVTIPMLKTFGVETRNIVLVPKRSGVIKIMIEVECEFGGDYELLTTYVRESGIERRELTTRLFDLTGDKKTFGPFVEKITQSPFLRFVKFAVSGTGLDRFVKRYTMETNSLIGVDRALIRLYRALGLRRYLNATMQTDSYLFKMAAENITTAYQKLQLYADYNGSYSFVTDEGTPSSSLYLTSLAFGAMISPMMPFRDNVTLNRTLNYILSRQLADGSFDEMGPCFHERFCSGEFRRETMTALVLYSLTHDNASWYMPEFVRRQLFNGEQSPIMRARRFLESRVPAIKSNWMTLTFVEIAFMECNCISEQLRQRIREALFARELTVVPEDGSKFLKIMDDKFTFDDQMLLNAMTSSLYARFGDFKTTSAISRYTVSQIQSHPHYDTIVDAIFFTEEWLHTDCLFRKEFDMEKFAVTVDVTTDNGQKRQFKIDARNIDLTQKMSFKMPVQTVTYSVSGFGFIGVCLKEVYVEKQPMATKEVSPFQLTQEFTSMPWLSEIKCKTCFTYTPTPRREVRMETFNDTLVIEVHLPSGMRINLRQIGFFLGRVEHMMHFTYDFRAHKLNFFLSLPSTMFGKSMCFDWVLERLSHVMNYSPIEVRAYDYVRPEMTFSRLFPVQIQPPLLGYSYVDAVIKARPTIEEMSRMEKEHQRHDFEEMGDTTLPPSTTRRY